MNTDPVGQRQKLESLKADELRRRAGEAGYSGVSRLKKEELVDLLLRAPVEPDELAGMKAASPSGAHTSRRSPTIPSRWLKAVGLIGGAASLLLMLVLPAASLWAGARLKGNLDTAASTLEAGAAGMELAAANLESGVSTLESASQALLSADQSIRAMDPLLDSVSTLLADDLPGTFEATQEALLSAQDGAAAMDRVLRGLRLLGLNYNPPLPLDQSLAQTAASLEGLPESLRQTEQDLSNGRRDLSGLSGDLAGLSRNLDIFSGDLSETSVELAALGRSMESMAASMQIWSGRLPWLRWLVALASLFFGLWLVALNASMWQIGSLDQPSKQDSREDR